MRPWKELTPAERRERFGECEAYDTRGEYERGLIERYRANLTLSLSDKRFARRLIRESL
jgi:hypothetical protein